MFKCIVPIDALENLTRAFLSLISLISRPTIWGKFEGYDNYAIRGDFETPTNMHLTSLTRHKCLKSP